MLLLVSAIAVLTGSSSCSRRLPRRHLFKSVRLVLKLGVVSLTTFLPVPRGTGSGLVAQTLVLIMLVKLLGVGVLRTHLVLPGERTSGSIPSVSSGGGAYWHCISEVVGLIGGIQSAYVKSSRSDTTDQREGIGNEGLRSRRTVTLVHALVCARPLVTSLLIAALQLLSFGVFGKTTTETTTSHSTVLTLFGVLTWLTWVAERIGRSALLAVAL